jgi:hypothetical protein
VLLVTAVASEIETPSPVFSRVVESLLAIGDETHKGSPILWSFECTFVKAKNRVSVRLPFSYSNYSHENNLCNFSASVQSEFTFHQNPIVSTGKLI